MAAKKGITNFFVWILMGLLVLGLAGFGATNLSGSIDSVGRVGETEIDLQEYARAMQNEISAEAAARQTPVNFVMAQELRIDQRILAQLIQAAALEEEARLMGVSIGDANLADQIRQIPAFRGVDGSFDREAYRFAIERAGQNEAQFEEGVRADTARSLLQGAVLAGVAKPDSYTDALLTYLGEERSVSFAMLDRGALETGLPVPTEDDLITYHQTHLPDFTTPETKRITYAWVSPAMIIDTIEVDEASLREAYEDRIEEYVQPERRLVERLALGTTEDAAAAKARIDSGETSFDALVEERGLTLAAIDLGDVSLSELEGAGEAVFAADVGSVIGPLGSSVGPALFRVNGVLNAQEVTFEEAEPALRDELAGDRARRVLESEADPLIDMLAEGATLEDLARETDMELGTIDWHPGVTDGIGAYAAFRAAAAELSEDDFPDIAALEDESLFAMRLDAIIEPEIQPLDAVRAQVEAGWRSDAVIAALRAQVEPLLAPLSTSGDFGPLGTENVTSVDVTRNGFQPDAPPEFIDTVFGLTEGEVTVLDGEARIFVMRLDAIAPPDMQAENMIRLRNILREDAASSFANDLYLLLSSDIRTRAGVELDERALNSVHSNFQ